MKVWVNGNIIDRDNAISSSDRGFTLGDGAFETMYYDNGKIEWFEMHMIRLKSTLSAIYINMKYDDGEILNAVNELFKTNQMQSGAVRLTVSRGAGARGLAFDTEQPPTVLISIANANRLQPPIKLCLTDYVRNEKSPLASYKMLNYTDAVMAFNTAKMRGFGDGLMLNTVGNIACSTMANVFLLKGNNLITPSLDDGCLPGIMRSVVLSIAKKMDLVVSEKNIKVAHLESADAVFLTNSIMRLKKVAEFENTVYDLENETVAQIEKELQK